MDIIHNGGWPGAYNLPPGTHYHTQSHTRSPLNTVTFTASKTHILTLFETIIMDKVTEEPTDGKTTPLKKQLLNCGHRTL